MIILTKLKQESSLEYFNYCQPKWQWKQYSFEALVSLGTHNYYSLYLFIVKVVLIFSYLYKDHHSFTANTLFSKRFYFKQIFLIYRVRSNNSDSKCIFSIQFILDTRPVYNSECPVDSLGTPSKCPPSLCLVFFVQASFFSSKNDFLHKVDCAHNCDCLSSLKQIIPHTPLVKVNFKFNTNTKINIFSLEKRW